MVRALCTILRLSTRGDPGEADARKANGLMVKHRRLLDNVQTTFGQPSGEGSASRSFGLTAQDGL